MLRNLPSASGSEVLVPLSSSSILANLRQIQGIEEPERIEIPSHLSEEVPEPMFAEGSQESFISKLREFLVARPRNQASSSDLKKARNIVVLTI